MPIDTGLDANSVLEKLSEGGVLLSYLNPFAWNVIKHDAGFRANLESMDMVVCDGIAIQSALNRFLGRESPIISLDDSGIGPQYLKLFQQRGSRLCLVGAKQDVLDKAQEALKQRYPGINILAAFSGYGNGPENARDYILKSEPEVVLAAMGMGRQEAFLQSLRLGGWQDTGIAVGAYFDRLANPKLDYPGWSRRYNVRFLGNIVRRPAYYLRRYCVDYLPFIKQYVSHVLHRKGPKK